MLVLAVGSTTPIDDVEILAVDRGKPLEMLRLREGDRTVFYERHVQPALWFGAKRDIWGTCPATEFEILFAAMERISAEAVDGKRTIETIPRNLPKLRGRMLSLGQAAAKSLPSPQSVAEQQTGAAQPVAGQQGQQSGASGGEALADEEG